MEQQLHGWRRACVRMDFFVAHYTFKEGTDAMSWWSEMADAKLSHAAKMQHERGIFSHCFLPSDMDTPILGVWECREPTTTADMQAFLDGPARLAGDVITQRVHKIDAASGALTPSSA